MDGRFNFPPKILEVICGIYFRCQEKAQPISVEFFLDTTVARFKASFRQRNARKILCSLLPAFVDMARSFDEENGCIVLQVLR